ncbi:MAG TPA: 50S ribosomal protein L11 methyltransferase [Bdellovibrionota bacterium]|jgi:ribosomal protein L11 methyltransferase
MTASYFVRLALPKQLAAEARDSFSVLVSRIASRFSFQGLEDWQVDLKRSRVLGIESEFHDLTKVAKPKPEMRVYFASKADAVKFGKFLSVVFADLRVSPARKLVSRDWMKLWRKHYKTQFLQEGKQKLAIVPSWKKAPRAGLSVRITPGQAFGTGTHPTTQLCLRLLLRQKGSFGDALDFGAGTGVLAIAAAKRAGPGFRGLAVESDPVALEQCRKNVRLNRVKGLRLARKLETGRKFDLVFANVLAPVLLANKKTLVGAIRPGGLIFLSGILAKEIEKFRRDFRSAELSHIQTLRQGDWAAVAFRRK